MLRLFARFIHSFSASLECSSRKLCVHLVLWPFSTLWPIIGKFLVKIVTFTTLARYRKITRNADVCWWLVDGWHLEKVTFTFLSAFWSCLAYSLQIWPLSCLFQGGWLGDWLWLLLVVVCCLLVVWSWLVGCRLSVGCFWLFSFGLFALGWWLCQGGWQTRYWPSPIPWPASFLSTPSSRD